MSKTHIKRKNWLKKKVRTKKSLGALGKFPRLIVFKSNKHFYSQLLDDNNSVTMLSSSSKDKALLKTCANGKNKTDISKEVGYDTAKKIKNDKHKQVIFDRNGYKYHGRVKAFAEAVREKGIRI